MSSRLENKIRTSNRTALIYRQLTPILMVPQKINEEKIDFFLRFLLFLYKFVYLCAMIPSLD
jgi:Uma2 family endonuclease